MEKGFTSDGFLLAQQRGVEEQVKVVACPGFEPTARLLKRSLILRCFSLLSREKSLIRR
jgi:hypothetical protein